MPYDFTAPEQVQIASYYSASPAPDQPGNFSPMYDYIAQRLEIPAMGDPALQSSRAWFRGAALANSGQGNFSRLIREFSRREGQLHGLVFTNTVGPLGIQEASNNVARRVYGGLSGTAPPPSYPLPPWRAPGIDVIANSDATAVGDTLFASLPGDTALIENAAWSGTLLFSQLGSDQTGRLIRGSGATGVADTLDDYRNIVYAQQSYLYAAAELTTQFSLDAANFVVNPWSNERDIACEGANRGFFERCTVDLLEGTVVAPYFNNVAQFRGGSGRRALDLIRNGYSGSFGASNSVASNSEATAAFFRPFGTGGQSITVLYQEPSALLETALLIGADRLDARQAIEGLSPFLVKGGSAPAPSASLDQNTDRYTQDRAEMLEARLVYDRIGLVYGAADPYVPSFARTVQFNDLRDGIALSIDNSILPSLSTQQVRFGGTGGDTILGGGGDDAFYGREGADQLTGSTGHDYFEGGAGSDTYNVGSGNDVVDDSDGAGAIRFNSVTLTGGARVGADLWQSGDNRFRFLRFAASGATRLLITDATTSDTVEVRNFDFGAGSLGITLPGAGTPTPPTQTIAPGDTAVTRRNLYDPGSPLSDLIDTSSGTQYDNVLPSAGNDVIRTGGGGDRIFGGDDADSISGEADRDYIKAGSETSADVTVIANDTDVVAGGAGTDNLSGGIGRDVVYAGAAGDAIDTGGTNVQGDWLMGGKGDDAIFGSIERDFVNGGAGRDVVLAGASDDVILGDGAYDFELDGSTISFDKTLPGFAAKHSWNGASWQTQTSGTLPAGQSFTMVLTPTAHFQFSLGLNADDFTFTPATTRPAGNLVRAESEGANDVLRGGPGNDWIAGQTGDDVLLGEDGNDRLVGDDFVALPAGSLPGKDLLYGGAGNDRLFGNQSDDTLYGDDGDDFLLGDDDTDATGSADRLFGGRGVDQLFGGAGADQLFGEDGDDSTLVGGGGNDEIRGGRGNDTLAGDGPGQTGNDVLSGDEGDDSLMGDDGTDTLLGGIGGDTLSGDAGDDTLSGGSGVDFLSGGAGNDRYVFEIGDDSSATGTTLVNDTGSGNRIVFGAGIYPQQVRLTTASGDLDVDYTTADRVRVVAGAGGAVIGTYEFADGRVIAHADIPTKRALGGSFKAVLALNAPSQFGDYIVGTAAGETINLLGGDDIGFGMDGNDTLDGGAGNDAVDGVNGDDIVRGGDGNDRLWGGDGNDSIEGQVGSDALFGGLGNDMLDGGSGDDEIHGGDGADQLIGDVGNDTLIGAVGADVMMGGPGADLYLFRPGDDPAPGVLPATRIEDINSPDVTNTIRFEDGISVDDVSLQIGVDAFVTLGITYTDPATGSHAVEVQCGASGDVLNRFEFGDGSVYTFQQMLARQGLSSSSSSSCPRPIKVFRDGFEGP